jgi:hypothetical protein
MTLISGLAGKTMVASVVMKTAAAGEWERQEGGKTEAGAERKIWRDEIGILFGVHQKTRGDMMQMTMMTDLDHHRITRTTAIGSGERVSRLEQESTF